MASTLDLKLEVVDGALDAAGCRDVLVSLQTPEGTALGRAAVDVVAVVDVSGSMNESADSAAIAQRTGLSVLDVVRHALRAVIHTLGPNDRFAVVTYSSEAQVLMDFRCMDEAGRAAASEAVGTMIAEGQTNMWQGIERGLDLLAQLESAPRTRAAWVFTDGVPNLVPPRGHQGMLTKYKQARAGTLPGSLHTFGFGYSLDSALLAEMATLGDGLYSFIPDAAMVGTVFVHATANLLACLAPRCVVTIDVRDGSLEEALLPTLGKRRRGAAKGAATHLEVDIGQVCFGQSRDVVLKLSAGAGAEHVAATAVVHAPLTGETTVQGCAGAASALRVAQQRGRLEAVQAIGTALSAKDPAQGHEAVGRVLEALRAKAVVHEEEPGGPLADLLQDLDGQVMMALGRRDWFDRWGQHYLPSLQQAHARQVCNNFKDPGVQHYGGAVFRESRDYADDKFNLLPAPTPAPRAPEPASAAPATRTTADFGNPQDFAFSMSMFNMPSGACFASGSVLLASGDEKPVEQVTRGDVLATPAGPRAVQCVVETRFPPGFGGVDLVDLGRGVLVTPWHPVRAHPTAPWSFPAELGRPRVLEAVPAVYSLLLDGAPAFTIGGVEGVALGHEERGNLAEHAFFGSRARVVSALSFHDGFAEGHVVLGPDALLRGPGGQVVTIAPPRARAVQPTADHSSSAQTALPA